ncbi:Rid family detoxifying hydrolase [Sporomusa sphaeroides]|uniref:Enamine/imine deaminase n=1 Tax=Sporomusa sphaeroides DSM 2875 TaxID=1337886 RepID=A0ABP2C9L5_9FIRM|nr:Rid family detoxifying hydrolase [Sporomusa sphaeroides]OLS54634.1 2-iminobutanoate/2-iminopropanoate deaminase [Sporomusa sphaeroides DSM 2875]CVK20835.1 Enamine/imine deaminase [Sporomusa sphaeroides DSM 2875]
MSLDILKSASAPKAIGPYSHGTKCGNVIITSGQIPLDSKTNQMVTDIREATQLVLSNLLSVVEAGGGRLDTVAKVDVFVKSLDDFAAINEVYSAFFKDHKPARVLIEAGNLPANAPLEAAMIAFVAE